MMLVEMTITKKDIYFSVSLSTNIILFKENTIGIGKDLLCKL